MRCVWNAVYEDQIRQNRFGRCPRFAKRIYAHSRVQAEEIATSICNAMPGLVALVVVECGR